MACAQPATWLLCPEAMTLRWILVLAVVWPGCGSYMSRSELIYGYQGLACAAEDQDCVEVGAHLSVIHGEFEAWCGTVKAAVFSMLVRMNERAVPGLERALDLDGYAYSNTAASALRAMGAVATIDRWCVRNRRAPSRPWICDGRRWSELWPELRHR